MTAFAPCPKCRSASAERVKFTWWGGVLGPKLLTHVKCTACGYKYNGRSGKDNSTGIAIYFAVIAVIAFGLMFVIFAVLAFLAATR